MVFSANMELARSGVVEAVVVNQTTRWFRPVVTRFNTTSSPGSIQQIIKSKLKRVGPQKSGIMSHMTSLFFVNKQAATADGDLHPLSLSTLESQPRMRPWKSACKLLPIAPSIPVSRPLTSSTVYKWSEKKRVIFFPNERAACVMWHKLHFIVVELRNMRRYSGRYMRLKRVKQQNKMFIELRKNAIFNHKNETKHVSMPGSYII